MTPTFTFATLACVVIASLNPINSTLSRTAFLAILALAAFTLYRHFRPRSPSLIALTAGSLLIFSFLIAFLPGHPSDPDSLRSRYLSALHALEGTRYIWGGEGRFGIDCSGLPRRALRAALFREALANLNPAPIRDALDQWWHDASALALSEAYRDYTVPLNLSGKLKSLDTSTLLPGDLAITQDGLHLLVYHGNDSWTQADPSIGKVITLNSRTDSNLWFHSPVTLHRWTQLVPLRAF